MASLFLAGCSQGNGTAVPVGPQLDQRIGTLDLLVLGYDADGTVAPWSPHVEDSGLLAADHGVAVRADGSGVYSSTADGRRSRPEPRFRS